MISKVKTFFKTGKRRKILAFQTFAFSIYTGILFSFFKRYSHFGEKENATDAAKKDIPFEDEKANQRISDIAWAIQVIDKNIPWKNVCRHQAYQAKLLCDLYHIPCRIYVGFKKDKESNEIQAHAWTTANNQIITGFCDPEEYIIQNIYDNKWTQRLRTSM